MTDHLGRPDSGTSYIKKAEPEKHDYKEAGLCMAKCAEETESCKGYDWSIIFGGCQYFSRCSEKCLRPKETK